MPTDRHDVAIVGAGIIGLAIARELALAGRRVLLVDRGPPGGDASAASAGMLAAQVEAHAGEALLRFGVTARERHHALAAALAKGGHDVGLRTDGILVVALEQDKARDLEAQAA